MWKRTFAKVGLAIGALALYWLLDAAGLIKDSPATKTEVRAIPAERPAVEAQGRRQPTSPQGGAREEDATRLVDDGIVEDGEYYDKGGVSAYIRKFNGKLPKNYITKDKARALGWQGGPLEPFAPGKAIGGDRFGNYERRLPDGNYRECDIDTRGKPRGVKRLIYTTQGKKIYYTDDHYETFEEVPAR